MVKTVVRSLVLEVLREFADLEYQRRVWARGSPTEVSGINDATAALYDDSGLDDALEKNAVTFSKEIDAQLRKLLPMLKAFQELAANQPISKLIETPEWSAVRERAHQIAAAIEQASASQKT